MIIHTVYIYHALVINVFIYFGLIGAWYFLLLAIMISVLLSTFSWVLIERPALALKHGSLRKMAFKNHTKRGEETSIISDAPSVLGWHF